MLIPRYRGIDLDGARRVHDSLPVWLGGRSFQTSILRVEGENTFYFLDCPELFDRDGYYGEAGADYPDNAVRFAVFCRGALALARYLFQPHIIHCNDWQTGLLPVYLKTTFANDPTFEGIGTLFTIHNLGYQGLAPAGALPAIGLDAGYFTPGRLEFFGSVSLIKGGLNFADALTTVSERYAQEIQTPEFGFGLDGVLRARSGVLHGILNGADYTEWNPETDRYIAANYSTADIRGKRACKADLLREFGLPDAAIDRPVAGVVSRLTSQKGSDLIAAVADDLAMEDIYLAALGSGEAAYEEEYLAMAARNPGHIAVRIGYDDALAHKIEAGSDIFLMPSRYEPCGLNQMYSLRYGTIPVAHATGGLDDTIEEGTGFKFAEYSDRAFLQAIRTACSVFEDPETWAATMQRGMRKDFSWGVSAARYSALYRRLLHPSAEKNI